MLHINLLVQNAIPVMSVKEPETFLHVFVRISEKDRNSDMNSTLVQNVLQKRIYLISADSFCVVMILKF